MKIPVVWWNSEGRGSWACVHSLNEMFDLYGCEHHPRMDDDFSTTIIVLHGGNAQLNGNGTAVAEQINELSHRLECVIFINIGDETSEFPVHLLSHPNSRLWLQTPLPSQKADRYLIEGYTHGTVNLSLKRDLDWFFAGQINHERRIACGQALSQLHNGQFYPTTGFGKGLPYVEYNKYMNRAKLVPCPSGPTSPDCFRIWEALECGAIPIIDASSPRQETVGFWDVVIPGHPLTVIEDWSMLPEVMGEILGDYERIHRRVMYWWKTYKLKYRSWLAEDLLRLRAR